MLTWKEQAEILKVLGDPTRLQMVALMREHEMCVCEFVALFDMSQPAVSQHVRRLKSVNLVKETRQGQWIFYQLNKDHEACRFIEPLLERLPELSHKITELEQKGLRVCR
ncbi:transcriptional regulator [Caldalkalibacillus thermarum]|uniref:ArsR/SmtB family transcription factor n=1 Tax=Caldalkalibacillus thermarum TaxID=296745 RepID=UPI00166BA6BA|nr:metalloregulator ArsR/SmtB family transcription factor [Caldalkalibacillus thermarum]GGK20637.1 transcriptional regulator [Caldalkalibacillus thermarum]